MAKLTKKQKEALAKFDRNQVYTLEEAVEVVKKITYTNKKLKAKTKYFYKIRPYRVVNGKTVFAAYSNVKYIKTKKK